MGKRHQHYGLSAKAELWAFSQSFLMKSLLFFCLETI